MKRAIFFAAILISAIAAQAQVHPEQADTNYLQKKWFITKYAGISTGFVAFKGGSANYLSAPLELMINRQLSNNLVAFGGVSATPYLLQYNGAFYQPSVGKNYSSMRVNNSGIYPAAKVGLMYISNDRSFSISGSVSVSRSNYYGYSPIYAPVNPHLQ